MPTKVTLLSVYKNSTNTFPIAKKNCRNSHLTWYPVLLCSWVQLQRMGDFRASKSNMTVCAAFDMIDNAQPELVFLNVVIFFKEYKVWLFRLILILLLGIFKSFIIIILFLVYMVEINLFLLCFFYPCNNVPSNLTMLLCHHFPGFIGQEPLDFSAHLSLEYFMLLPPLPLFVILACIKFLDLSSDTSSTSSLITSFVL